MKPSDSFIPSGALLKAMLVQSARAVSQLIDVSSSGSITITDLKSDSYPSNSQGYGRIELSRLLQFNSPSSTNPLSLFALGDVNSMSPLYVSLNASSQVDTYVINTGEKAPSDRIRVTLAYTDYPASASDTSILKNVLVLKVTESTSGSTQTMSGNSVLVVDFSSPRALTSYIVSVYSTTLLTQQPYALVMTGQVNFLNASTSNDGSSSATELSRLQHLSNSHLSPAAVKYIAVMSVFAALLLVAACYLYWLIRIKVHGNPFADDFSDDGPQLGTRDLQQERQIQRKFEARTGYTESSSGLCVCCCGNQDPQLSNPQESSSSPTTPTRSAATNERSNDAGRGKGRVNSFSPPRKRRENPPPA